MTTQKAEELFDLSTQIGKGAYARVYAVRHGSATRALKVYETPHGGPFGLPIEEEARRLLKAANRGVAPMPFEVGQNYILMELIKGEELGDWMWRITDPEKFFDAAEALAMLAQELLDAGAAHGDFHTGNVIVTKDGFVAIDFGVPGSQGDMVDDLLSYLDYVNARISRTISVDKAGEISHKHQELHRVSSIQDVLDWLQEVREILE